MFTKDSALVKIWVSLILAGVYTYEQCPDLSNLKTVVGEVLAEIGYQVSAQ
ncbi:hypothetical protein [Desulforamulus hydrothermalis]|uniref:Uncharacterized protein n=1 Tax=Desulforamulus hydrothermalis Lam5 = DSM 18033 TaxID=1121428 RepID=K8DZ65_9FIRM|nr:hypothetical protein [Desulforamulus hydrothermalis]CCO08284.1 conserved hypothetical protein [Desulforamulus hydrothermalis Lam5 = DSM 18033]SHH37705.1 hypothetical protein SAMN02745177_02351 [Desulforamulus hydrothermalis Lam5 = DSM 18033]